MTSELEQFIIFPRYPFIGRLKREAGWAVLQLPCHKNLSEKIDNQWSWVQFWMRTRNCINIFFYTTFVLLCALSRTKQVDAIPKT